MFTSKGQYTCFLTFLDLRKHIISNHQGVHQNDLLNQITAKQNQPVYQRPLQRGKLFMCFMWYLHNACHSTL